MNRQVKTPRAFIRTTVPAVLRGLAVFLLFTHQAWANIGCCGVNRFAAKQSDHQIIEERDSAAEMNAQSGHCHSVELIEEEQPGAGRQANRFTQPPEEIPWCCQTALVAEPQLPILSSKEQARTIAAPTFFAVTTLAPSVYINTYSPPKKSRPILLITSCLLI